MELIEHILLFLPYFALRPALHSCSSLYHLFRSSSFWYRKARYDFDISGITFRSVEEQWGSPHLAYLYFQNGTVGSILNAITTACLRQIDILKRQENILYQQILQLQTELAANYTNRLKLYSDSDSAREKREHQLKHYRFSQREQFLHQIKERFGFSRCPRVMDCRKIVELPVETTFNLIQYLPGSLPFATFRRFFNSEIEGNIGDILWVRDSMYFFVGPHETCGKEVVKIVDEIIPSEMAWFLSELKITSLDRVNLLYDFDFDFQYIEDGSSRQRFPTTFDLPQDQIM